MELVVILAVFLAFIIFSNSRRAKQAKALEASLAVGVQVIMLGGIKGKVVSIIDDNVIVESTPGTRIAFLKGAVRTVVPASLDAKAVAVAPKAKAKPADTKPAAKKSAAPKTTATKKPAAPKTTATKKTAK
jgi:preprotein translocase subunit YajC